MSANHFDPDSFRVINAAGKLTALGGAAQSAHVTGAMTSAAASHVDLAAMRQYAGEQIANLTGAEAACVTSGAAAGISIATAACITGDDVSKVLALPGTTGPSDVILQAGHAVNFGAPVEQMIRLGGGHPVITGSVNTVRRAHLQATAAGPGTVALLFVQSHHCVQDNMVPLDQVVEIGRQADVPVIVDAAAEDDLTKYIRAGADLVLYSGGKAFGGPTSGFICGRADLIRACELQFQGIARTMKVGKESIAGLLAALQAYASDSDEDRRTRFDKISTQLCEGLAALPGIIARLAPDEAGRAISRVRVETSMPGRSIHDLVEFLRNGRPSVRTRNHHIDQGYLLLDPRELTPETADVVVQQIRRFIETV